MPSSPVVVLVTMVGACICVDQVREPAAAVSLNFESRVASALKVARLSHHNGRLHVASDQRLDVLFLLLSLKLLRSSCLP